MLGRDDDGVEGGSTSLDIGGTATASRRLTCWTAAAVSVPFNSSTTGLPVKASADDKTAQLVDVPVGSTGAAPDSEGITRSKRSEKRSAKQRDDLPGLCAGISGHRLLTSAAPPSDQGEHFLQATGTVRAQELWTQTKKKTPLL